MGCWEWGIRGEGLEGKRLVNSEKMDSSGEGRRWGGKRGYRGLAKDAEERRQAEREKRTGIKQEDGGVWSGQKQREWKRKGRWRSEMGRKSLR